jgi:hypothetical protein
MKYTSLFSNKRTITSYGHRHIQKTIYPALTISILLLSIFPMVANSFNFNEVAFGLEQQTQLQFAKSQ